MVKINGAYFIIKNESMCHLYRRIETQNEFPCTNNNTNKCWKIVQSVRFICKRFSTWTMNILLKNLNKISHGKKWHIKTLPQHGWSYNFAIDIFKFLYLWIKESYCHFIIIFSSRFDSFSEIGILVAHFYNHSLDNEKKTVWFIPPDSAMI